MKISEKTINRFNKTSQTNLLILDMDVTISLKPDDWTRILEQILLVILIMGRWLLPKGNISRFEKDWDKNGFFFCNIKKILMVAGGNKIALFHFFR